jgi:hypothetical protein
MPRDTSRFIGLASAAIFFSVLVRQDVGAQDTKPSVFSVQFVTDDKVDRNGSSVWLVPGGLADINGHLLSPKDIRWIVRQSVVNKGVREQVIFLEVDAKDKNLSVVLLWRIIKQIENARIPEIPTYVLIKIG